MKTFNQTDQAGNSPTTQVRSACDWHVISTPPAFIQSQDQTLHTQHMKTVNQTDQAGNSPIPGTTTTHPTYARQTAANHLHKNGFKQTCHTIEFSNNHTTHQPAKASQHAAQQPTTLNNV